MFGDVRAHRVVDQHAAIDVDAATRRGNRSPARRRRRRPAGRSRATSPSSSTTRQPAPGGLDAHAPAPRCRSARPCAANVVRDDRRRLGVEIARQHVRLASRRSSRSRPPCARFSAACMPIRPAPSTTRLVRCRQRLAQRERVVERAQHVKAHAGEARNRRQHRPRAGRDEQLVDSRSPRRRRAAPRCGSAATASTCAPRR